MVAANRRAVSALRSLAAGMTGLALLVGVPVVLWTVIGNPLSGFPQSWTEAELLFDQRNVTAELLISLLACVLWLLWLQFVWAVLWEIFVIGPRTNRGEVAKDAPGVPGFVRSIVSTVVSGLLSASVVASATSAGTLLPDLVAKAPALALDHRALNELATVDQAASATTNITHYVIGEHDRVWDLAGQNDAMLQRILEMNADQVKSPIDFRPGMQIRVPASLALPEAPPAGVGAAQNSGHEGSHDPRIHEVVKGDNLWNISKDQLAADTGVDPSNREIAAHVADVVDDNKTVIEDPDLIYPGELLSLPEVDGAVPTSAVASSAATAEHGTETDQAETDQVDPETSAAGSVSSAEPRVESSVEPSEAGESAAGPPDEHEQSDVVSTGLSLVDSDGTAARPVGPEPEDGSGDLRANGTTPPQPAPATIDSTPVEPPGEPTERAAEVGAHSPAPVGTELVGGGLALSTSLLALYLAARRRNEGRFAVEFSRRDRAPEPDLLTEIYGAADLDFVDWAAQRLADSHADESLSGATAGALVLSRGRGLETWWSTPVRLSTGGWTMVGADGRRWAVSWDADEVPGPTPDGDIGDAGHEGRAPLGWLTVGALIDDQLDDQQDGELDDRSVANGPDHGDDHRSDVMINLDHVGSIALSGATSKVFGALRAMIFELGAGGPLADVTVTTVDFQAEGSTALPRLSAAREDDALAQAGAGHPDGLLQVFVVQATQARLDRWFELARPGSGVALLAVGDVRSSRLGSRFVLNDNGTGSFQGLDAPLQVFGLDTPDAVRIEDLILGGDTADVGQPPGVGD